VVTTLAGSASGSAGSSDGYVNAAQFNQPTGVAVDSAGNLFVADSNNDTLREVTPSGLVTTIAGSPGVTGSVDGLCANARFYTPADVAVDARGVVYVADNVNNTLRRIVPGALAAPQVQTQPASETVKPGQTAEFTVGAGGSPPLSFQWKLEKPGSSLFTNLSDGSGISGSSTSTLSVADPTAAMTGDKFECVVANNAGTATSGSATLTVNAAAPVIDTDPISQAINTGGTVVFTVVASGTGPATTYRWTFDGANVADTSSISGAAGPQLILSGVTSANKGTYECVISNGGISVETPPATLYVVSSADPGSVSAASARALVGSGDDVLALGFRISGTSSATVLIQAIDLDGTALPHPAISLHQTQGGTDVVLYSNTRWGSNPVLLNAAAKAGALPVLQPGSADSELLLTLPPGAYTAEVTGATGGTGVVLCAVYQLP
jgi:hypothetical protein